MFLKFITKLKTHTPSQFHSIREYFTCSRSHALQERKATSTKIRPQGFYTHTGQGSTLANALEAKLVQSSDQCYVPFKYAWIFLAVCEVKRESVTPPPVTTCHLLDFTVLILSNNFRGFGVFSSVFKTETKELKNPKIAFYQR